MVKFCIPPTAKVPERNTKFRNPPLVWEKNPKDVSVSDAQAMIFKGKSNLDYTRRELTEAVNREHNLGEALMASERERNTLKEALTVSEQNKDELRKALEASQTEKDELKKALEMSQTEKDALQRALEESEIKKDELFHLLNDMTPSGDKGGKLKQD